MFANSNLLPSNFRGLALKAYSFEAAFNPKTTDGSKAQTKSVSEFISNPAQKSTAKCLPWRKEPRNKPSVNKEKNALSNHNLKGENPASPFPYEDFVTAPKWRSLKTKGVQNSPFAQTVARSKAEKAQLAKLLKGSDDFAPKTNDTTINRSISLETESSSHVHHTLRGRKLRKRKTTQKAHSFYSENQSTSYYNHTDSESQDHSSSFGIFHDMTVVKAFSRPVSHQIPRNEANGEFSKAETLDRSNTHGITDHLGNVNVEKLIMKRNMYNRKTLTAGYQAPKTSLLPSNSNYPRIQIKSDAVQQTESAASDQKEEILVNDTMLSNSQQLDSVLKPLTDELFDPIRANTSQDMLVVDESQTFYNLTQPLLPESKVNQSVEFTEPMNSHLMTENRSFQENTERFATEHSRSRLNTASSTRKQLRMLTMGSEQGEEPKQRVVEVDITKNYFPRNIRRKTFSFDLSQFVKTFNIQKATPGKTVIYFTIRISNELLLAFRFSFKERIRETRKSLWISSKLGFHSEKPKFTVNLVTDSAN